MELLNRTYRKLHRLLGANLWLTGMVVGTLAGVEIWGRHAATTDLHDAVAAAVLGILAVVVGQRHRETPVAWVRWLGERWRKTWLWFRHFAMDVGVDLRGQPALPQGAPPFVTGALAAMFVAVALMVLFANHIPLGLRDAIIHVSYLLYVVLLVVFWSLLIAGIGVSFGEAIAQIHGAMLRQYSGKPQNRQRRELACVVAFFAVLGLAGLLLPSWLPLAVCGLAVAVNLLTIPIPSNTEVSFVWRYRGCDGPLRCIPWGRWMVWAFTSKVLILLALVLLARGAELFGQPGSVRDTMPITFLLGLLLAWLGPGAVVTTIVQMVVGRLRDPARSTRPVVHIAGTLSAGAWADVKRHFQQHGWIARRVTRAASSMEVAVQIVDQPPPEGEDGPSWPLAVTVASLQTEETLQRLKRRHEIQMRRRLIGGLERLFKHAAKHRYRKGFGYIIAPHYWFFPGLVRDSQEDEINLEDGTLLSGIIGPPYHRVLPHAVRHHVYEIMRGVQIDLIFVEDGVGFRRFSKVLRLLFEVYDVYGGRRRADEIHLQGIPGIRVLIHQYQLDKPFESQMYPEPEYEDFGRARILHIFKDRGEQEEPLETPFDLNRMPIPGAAY
jgi:hypothetical protein